MTYLTVQTTAPPLGELFGRRFEVRPMGLSIGPACRVNDKACNSKLILTGKAWYKIPNHQPPVGPGMTYLTGHTTAPRSVTTR